MAVFSPVKALVAERYPLSRGSPCGVVPQPARALVGTPTLLRLAGQVTGQLVGSNPGCWDGPPLGPADPFTLRSVWPICCAENHGPGHRGLRPWPPSGNPAVLLATNYGIGVGGGISSGMVSGTALAGWVDDGATAISVGVPGGALG